MKTLYCVRGAVVAIMILVTSWGGGTEARHRTRPSEPAAPPAVSPDHVYLYQGRAVGAILIVPGDPASPYVVGDTGEINDGWPCDDTVLSSYAAGGQTYVNTCLQNGVQEGTFYAPREGFGGGTAEHVYGTTIAGVPASFCCGYLPELGKQRGRAFAVATGINIRLGDLTAYGAVVGVEATCTDRRLVFYVSGVTFDGQAVPGFAQWPAGGTLKIGYSYGVPAANTRYVNASTGNVLVVNEQLDDRTVNALHLYRMDGSEVILGSVRANVANCP